MTLNAFYMSSVDLFFSSVFSRLFYIDMLTFGRALREGDDERSDNNESPYHRISHVPGWLGPRFGSGNDLAELGQQQAAGSED